MPYSHFDKHHVSHEQYNMLWRDLVGPHLKINSRLVEPWKLFCNVFIEGLLLGYGLAEKHSAEEPDAEPGSDYFGA